MFLLVLYSRIFTRCHNFQVTATEIHTTEKFSDSATVVFEITEVLANENNPKFNESSYSVNVTENSSPGMVVQVGRIMFKYF